jgi:hypothetical protein
MSPTRDASTMDSHDTSCPPTDLLPAAVLVVLLVLLELLLLAVDVLEIALPVVTAGILEEAAHGVRSAARSSASMSSKSSDSASCRLSLPLLLFPGILSVLTVAFK